MKSFFFIHPSHNDSSLSHQTNTNCSGPNQPGWNHEDKNTRRLFSKESNLFAHILSRLRILLSWSRHADLHSINCMFYSASLTFNNTSQRTAKQSLILLAPDTKIAEFANSVDLDEPVQNELSYLDLHCLPSIL